MKKLVVLLLVSLMASSAFAVIDPDPDMLGVYFDTNADNNCTTAGFFTYLDAYVTITNPSAPEVHGLEFGYDVVVTGGNVARTEANLPPEAVNIGQSTDYTTGDYVVGLATPLAGTPAVPFVHWVFLFAGDGILVEFYLSESLVPSLDNGLPAYEIGGTILPLGLSTGGPEIPVATVNGDCVVGVEETSFGSVKSLFR